MTHGREGFTSRSINRLNESVLESYQVIDKYDTNTKDAAEIQTKKIKHHLNRMKNDYVKSYVLNARRENARKEAKKLGLDVAAIPERGSGDDPFGLLDKASNESFQQTHYT